MAEAAADRPEEHERALRAEITAHKSAIRRHRAALCRAAEILARLQLNGTGIRPIVKGEGKNPWPTSSISTP